MRTLFALILLASAPAAFAQVAPPAFRYATAGLTVELPHGFRLEQSIEAHLPGYAGFFFMDYATGRWLTVALHGSFSEEQRAAWLAGERAGSDLASFTRVSRADAASLPLPAGAAFAIDMDEGGCKGLVLYGCDEDECYRVHVMGPAADFETAPAEYLALLRGVRLE